MTKNDLEKTVVNIDSDRKNKEEQHNLFGLDYSGIRGDFPERYCFYIVSELFSNDISIPHLLLSKAIEEEYKKLKIVFEHNCYIDFSNNYIHNYEEYDKYFLDRVIKIDDSIIDSIKGILKFKNNLYLSSNSSVTFEYDYNEDFYDWYQVIKELTEKFIDSKVVLIFKISKKEDLDKVVNVCSNFDNSFKVTIKFEDELLNDFNKIDDLIINGEFEKYIDILKKYDIDYISHYSKRLSAAGIKFDSLDDIKEFHKIIRLIIDRVPEDASELDKVVYISKFITSYFSYDYDNDNEKRSSLEFLRSRKGVCRDYAALTEYLLKILNVECNYICRKNAVKKTTGHAYNSVFIDGKIQYLDLTWVEKDLDKSNYFLTPSKTFFSSHKNYLNYYYRPDEVDSKKLERKQKEFKRFKDLSIFLDGQGFYINEKESDGIERDRIKESIRKVDKWIDENYVIKKRDILNLIKKIIYKNTNPLNEDIKKIINNKEGKKL